jgi:hypothetical protein
MKTQHKQIKIWIMNVRAIIIYCRSGGVRPRRAAFPISDNRNTTDPQFSDFPN